MAANRTFPPPETAAPRRRRPSLWRARRGNTAVELALMLPVLVPLTMGAVDFGRMAVERTAINRAARAGVHYAIQNQSTSADIPAIQAAARADYGDPTLLVTPRNYYSCPGMGEVQATDTCSDGEYAHRYVEVRIQASLDLMMAYPGVAQTQNFDVTSFARVR